ncbi:hypothetical protein fh0823_03460 [Francisella halioticida]|uniref:FUSC family protein n=1 Tax=Francisella halioticida TaxID=549298 RepID=A0ABM6LYB4_9GAMM|nr:hypothetical protein [Francisella halioticida]ASG67654.1 hypothetical protein CDV26_03945 [Francisella halioticida]BCD90207.1 hypothetical protein fh0823_03460 [Francisella halioticida]
MIFKLGEIYHKYADQDPTRVFRNAALKSALILFAFLTITIFLEVNKNVIILEILFIANMTAAILTGSIESKKKAFFLYVFSSMVAINISPYVYVILEKKILLFLPIIFIAFWIRRFGEAFLIFPVMLVIMMSICFFRFPLEADKHIEFTFLALLIVIAFYILIINRYKVMNYSEIRVIINSFFKTFNKSYIEEFENVKYRNFTKDKIIKFSQEKMKTVISLQNHGLMSLKRADHEYWRYFCHNIILLNRLFEKFILSYKKISLKYLNLAFNETKEEQALINKLEKIFKETIILTNYTAYDEKILDRKITKVIELQSDFKIFYTSKYLNNRNKTKLLFDSILLLENMLIGLQNIKEAYFEIIENQI